MLQIITGKFFRSDERHVSIRNGVLHTNYRWYLPIETLAGSLEALNAGSSLTTCIYNYTNQIEKSGGNFEIVRVGDGEIIEQFRLLCSFGFRATFSEDRSWVAHLCRSGTVGQSDTYSPSQIIPRYFTQQIHGNKDEAEEFVALVEKTLKLSRSDYLTVMSTLQAFCGALEVVGSSLDLAYSMIVYALEALSKKYIDYEPRWADFDHRIRQKMDAALTEVSNDTSEKIRDVLLSGAHLKLSANFVEFICTHVEDSFFTELAAKRKTPLQKSELRRAVKMIYNVRSSYVHQLTPLPHQLKVPQIAEGDVFRWNQEPNLTFNGLVHLADHVIRTLIARLPSEEKENYNWRDGLPGTIQMNLAPQYWIHRAEGFDPESAHRYYAGFLENFAACALRGEPICNMTAVAKKIEKSRAQGTPSQRRSMLALYFLFNACLHPESSLPNWEEFLEMHEDIVNQPCIEMMAARLLLDGEYPWDGAQGEAALNEYDRSRFHRGIFKITFELEIALIAAVANQLLREGHTERHQMLLKEALLNTAGRPEIQSALQTSIENAHEVDMNIVLPRKSHSDAGNHFSILESAAYSKYLERLESGRSGDAFSDWIEAETELLDKGQ